METTIELGKCMCGHIITVKDVIEQGSTCIQCPSCMRDGQVDLVMHLTEEEYYGEDLDRIADADLTQDDLPF